MPYPAMAFGCGGQVGMDILETLNIERHLLLILLRTGDEMLAFRSLYD
jgi:hypothetical protein